jgi:epoxyqueuosine reductase
MDRASLVTLCNTSGFHHVRLTPVTITPGIDRYIGWLDEGRHASMSYLEKNLDVRRDPTLRLNSAQTALVLAVDHHNVRPVRPSLLSGRVASYAWGRDYHNLMGKRLKRLRKSLREKGIDSWGGVDTAPVLERSWAEAAGMGFRGKNGMQIFPAHGSHFMLGVLFIEGNWSPDPVVGDHCGSCERCIIACPTRAIGAAGIVDSRKCLSYWSIEHSGVIPSEIMARFGDWFFGCDDCQTACPHNAKSSPSIEDDFLPRHGWVELDKLLGCDDDSIMVQFIGTPLRRPKAVGLRRNALVVLGNSGQETALSVVEPYINSTNTVLEETAKWAFAQLISTLDSRGHQ